MFACIERKKEFLMKCLVGEVVERAGGEITPIF